MRVLALAGSLIGLEGRVLLPAFGHYLGLHYPWNYIAISAALFGAGFLMLLHLEGEAPSLTACVLWQIVAVFSDGNNQKHGLSQQEGGACEVRQVHVERLVQSKRGVHSITGCVCLTDKCTKDTPQVCISFKAMLHHTSNEGSHSLDTCDVKQHAL